MLIWRRLQAQRNSVIQQLSARKKITILVAVLSIAVLVTLMIVTGVRFSKARDQVRRADSLTEEAIVLSERGEFVDAIGKYKKAIELYGGNWRVGLVHNNLAWLLATCPDDAIRNGTEAITHAKMASLMLWQDLDTLAAAYAETGQFDLALESIGKAIQDAPQEAKARLQQRRNRYQNGMPYREERGN